MRENKREMCAPSGYTGHSGGSGPASDLTPSRSDGGQRHTHRSPFRSRRMTRPRVDRDWLIMAASTCDHSRTWRPVRSGV